jgi:hypothetical protein
MVPRYPFPPIAESREAPHFQAGSDGFVETGYPCRLEPRTGILAGIGPPRGVVTVGGCRFALQGLQDEVRRADPEAGLAALPDALSGYRLAGHASDPERVRAALRARGANALLVDAFRDRDAQQAA